MSWGGPKLDSGGNDSEVVATMFIRDGELQGAKLISTLLGALWLTVVAGWILIVEAITLAHIRVLEAVANMYVRIIEKAGIGGAETIRASWASAFRAAVEAEPLLAPAILTIEILAVSALLMYATRRWF